MAEGDQPDPSQMAKVEFLKKQILSRILTKDAFERLARVRLANPELAGQVELYLMQIAQSGKLGGLVNEQQMKEILQYLVNASGAKKKNTIRRLY
ncbi:MAG TPA: DNA-binding protein [archaeon]|nr:DNA-binding protein [archaeon]